MSYELFCETYYSAAQKSAEVTVAKLKEQLNGDYDFDLAISIGITYSLEQAYKEYDPSKSASITTYLSKIVHNSIVSELKKQSRYLAKIDNSVDPTIKSSIGPYVSEFKEAYDIYKGKEQQIEKMLSVIEGLSPVDQVIIKCYLKDPSNYAQLAVEELGWTADKKNTVYVRFFRAVKHLKMLMGGQKVDYRDMYINPTKS